MKLLVAALILGPMLAQAQTAKVYKLPADEAAQAKTLYAEQAKVSEQIEELRAKITKEFFRTGKDTCQEVTIDGQRYDTCRDFFTGGLFDFSDDFQFVIPRPVVPRRCEGMLCESLPMHPVSYNY
jgi:hypothetical protein